MRTGPFLLSAAVAASVLAIAPAPAASAATPSAHMIVGFQDNGSACAATNSSVVVVDANKPAGQTASIVQNLGKPSGMAGVINEAKPFANNNKIVALWARSPAGNGGVGVFTRTSGYSGTWSQPVTFSQTTHGVDFGTNGGAHSVSMLPENYIAVAHVGAVPGWSGGGHVVLFRPNGTIAHHVTVESAHGVEWDDERGLLYTVGYKDVREFRFDRTAPNEKLVLQRTWLFPGATTSIPGGHDLRKRRLTDDFYVTTNTKTYVFDPEAASGSEFTTVTKDGGAALPSYVKTVDEGWDGEVEYGQWKANKFFYLDGREINGPACMLPYKARWIWGMNTPVFPADSPDTPAPPPATGSADPFIYQHEQLVANDSTPPLITEPIWAGHASWDSMSGVATEIRTQICAGKTPYVIFYHWGDGVDEPGETWRRSMSDVENASPGEVDDWVEFAESIALAIDGAAKACNKPERAYIILEHEWDVDVLDSACSPEFQDGLERVVGKFTDIAPDTLIVNSPGLYKPKWEYECFTKEHLFEQHGFGMMEVNGTTDCARKTDGSVYKSSKLTLADVDIVADVTYHANKLDDLFGAENVLLTDLSVTSCGWGPEGQAAIIQDLADGLTGLYESVGLRGVVLRDSGPEKPEDRATGNNNEIGFYWSPTSATATAVASGRSQMQTYLNNLGGTQPAFTSSVTVAPQNVAVGGTTHVAAKVTAKTALSNGVVSVEVWNGTTQVKQQAWPGTSMAAGTTHDFAFDWTPTAAGTYTVKVAVHSTGYATRHHWNENAATIGVGTADPAFTSSATASPSGLAPGATTTISATVQNTGTALSNGVVEVDVYSPNATPVHHASFPAQSIAAGASKTVTTSWTAPTTTGRYTVRVRVTGANGTPLYHANNGAGSVTVSDNRFTSGATVSRPTVAPENATTVTATVTNVGSAVSDAAVSVEVHGASGKVAQQTWTAQAIAAGASATYPMTWTPPAGTSGTFTVKVGVFGAGWTPLLHWNDDAATIGVTVPRFVADAASSPSTVGPGGTTDVTVTVTTEGGTLENAVVDLELYDAAGNMLKQKGWTGVTLTNGTTTTLVYPWVVPTTTGTYKAKVGVMGPGWSPTYKWNDNADTITVANPSFTSGATVSASSVTPGQAVDITATWTATGGSVTNSRFQIAIDRPDGSRLLAQDYVAALADGASLTKTYTWTTPLTPTGTYKIRLGVFTNDWVTQHWNGTAGTVAVGASAFQPSFRVGDGANNWWIEVYTPNDVTGVDVIGKDGAFYLSLEKKSWGAWGGTAPSSLGTTDLVRFVARRSTDGATAGSNNFYWLAGTPATDPGWSSTFTVGTGASTSWVEVYASPSATAVEVKVGTGTFTALTKQATGAWAKAMPVPAGSKVVFRATRADGARAYSPFYNWLQ